MITVVAKIKASMRLRLSNDQTVEIAQNGHFTSRNSLKAHADMGTYPCKGVFVY